MENRFVRQTFNSGGTWVCPAGVTQVLVWGMGGGAGGGGGSNATASAGGAGGYGGMGVCLQPILLTVVPNTSYTITIGAGGAGGPNTASASAPAAVGGAGTDSSFGALAVFKGAPTNGTTGTYQHYSIGSSGWGVLTTTSSVMLIANQATAANFNFAGTATGAYHGLSAANGTFVQSTTTGAFGAGGGSGEGIGGAGGSNAGAGAAGTAGTAAAANSGAGGGGGAGGSTVSQAGASGGAGGSGQIIVCWAE